VARYAADTPETPQGARQRADVVCVVEPHESEVMRHVDEATVVHAGLTGRMAS
jgi:hypothetical protein